MFVVASVSYFSSDRCPDEVIFMSAVVFIATYRIGWHIGLNMDVLFDAIEQMFNVALFGISDQLGRFVGMIKDEIHRQYTRIYNHFYPPPPAPRNEQSGRTRARFAN